MKATLTLNVEITAEEFIALGEKWAEINKKTPETPQPADSWVGKSVKIKPSIMDLELPGGFEKERTYKVVRCVGSSMVYVNGISYAIEKNKLNIV